MSPEGRAHASETRSGTGTSKNKLKSSEVVPYNGESSDEPGSKLLVLGMVIQPLIG